MAEADVLKVKEIALNLAESVQGFGRRRFLDWLKVGAEPRIKVLRGFRGVGKTTALLQLMADEKAIYFSVDHPYIEGHNLYELGKQLFRAGYNVLLVDEIHHYSDWKKETKALYDEFPRACIIVSGSAPLAFEPERRYDIIEADPMSLREFAGLQGRVVEATESWKSIDETLRFLAENNWIHEHYENYLRNGAFPIFFAYKEKTLPALYNSIRKSIREDAPFFAKVDGETIRAMERLLLSLATSQPGEFSVNSMAKHLELTKYKGYEIVSLLEAMKILRLVKPHGRGPKLVRGEPKLLFYHPNLRWAVCDALGASPSIGAVREELAVFSLAQRGWRVSTIKGRKKSPDYMIEKGKEIIVIEIGGQSKSKAQLAGFTEKKLVITDRQLITLALF